MGYMRGAPNGVRVRCSECGPCEVLLNQLEPHDHHVCSYQQQNVHQVNQWPLQAQSNF